MKQEITIGTVVFTEYINELFVVIAIRRRRDGVNEYLLDDIPGWWFAEELKVIAYA